MPESDNRPGRERTLESLLQLVAALDRRVPRQADGAGQQAAVGDSGLRSEATRRIDHLNRAADAAVDAQMKSDDAMTDDGAPVTAPGD